MLMQSTSEGTIRKATVAAKWSIATQLFSKLISPITTLILARLLAPEAFGVVATVNMVVSFAEMFSDAGFQKYLVQHEFKSERDLHKCANVAFWSNFTVSIVLWLIIAAFNEQIAILVGNEGLGNVIVITCVNLPLVSFCSVQTALFQRKFNFRSLFSAKIATSLITLFTAIPLALIGFDFWSLICGTIASNVALSIVLYIQSDWHPEPFYSFKLLQEMFSFSAWTLLEAFTVWLSSWMGTFVLGVVFDPYHLGLYKTATSLVASITSLATSAINPIIFATLSRFQSDREKFDSIFYKMQSYLAMVIVPLSLTLLVFREQIVLVMLGNQWNDASLFFGMYAAASSLVVVFGHTASEAYRALGKPRLSALAQGLYLLFITPCLYIFSSRGFEFFSWSIPVARAFFSIAVDFILCKVALNLSPLRMLKRQALCYLSGAVMSVFGIALIRLSANALIIQLIGIPVCLFIYLLLILARRPTRAMLFEMLQRLGIFSK